MTLRVLVLGGSGQVATALAAQSAPAGVSLSFAGRREADLTDPAAVAGVVAERRPDLVINAAAYTAVDRAESEPDEAEAVNHHGPAAVAEACRARSIPLLHYSTDYVFDGSADRPWREDDPPSPLGVYGHTKWRGEQAVRERLQQHIILRVSWVFSGGGRNFVRTMLRLGAERDTLGVVADQHGGPTAAADIARVTLALVERYLAEGVLPWGIYHFCGQPATTWHGFAEAIFRIARPLTPLAVGEVRAITTQEFPTPATRPANAVLDTSRFQSTFGLEQPDWRPALDVAVRELLREAQDTHR